MEHAGSARGDMPHSAVRVVDRPATLRHRRHAADAVDWSHVAGEQVTGR
jgi:hypothetical protein